MGSTHTAGSDPQSAVRAVLPRVRRG